MSRKRPASAIFEPNNNDSDTRMKEKKRRTMEMRLMAQLQSDFTEKMIVPIKSPNGQPTSRSGRKINKVEALSPRRQHKSATDARTDQCEQQKSTLSKRKSQPTESSMNTEPEIVDLCTDVSVSEQNFVAQMADDAKTESINDSLSHLGSVDYDVKLKPYFIDKFSHGIKSIESAKIIDEIDLTSSPDCSEHGDDTKSNNSDAQRFAVTTIETNSMAHRLNVSQDKTDSPKTFTTSVAKSNISTSHSSNANLSSDDPFSEERSDDCVIAECDDEATSSVDNWYIGQIVWAALFAYPFWPAIIFNEEESQTFRKDNQIHVKFLYDNGRRNWVNEKTSILPFVGREEFAEKCKLPANKRNKAYRINKCKSWDLAVHEANVLQYIKSDQRVNFYDTILMKVVHKMESEIRSNRRKTGDRCDTPQTFDTAYSSMKQSSSSPASLSPTLKELDRNYDFDKTKTINNYLKSVELSHPEKLPEEDLQLDESPSLAASLILSTRSTEHIYCRLAILVFERFRDDDIALNQSVIKNENQFVSQLHELWSKMADTKTAKSTPNTGSATKRISRQFSLDSSLSYSSSFTQHQTKRQRILAEKRTISEQCQTSIMVDEKPNGTVKITNEELKRKKQQMAEEFILDCYIKSHSANFLLKGLAKDPVCHNCLQSGNVIKCAGKCNTFFHRQCLNDEVKEFNYNDILKRNIQKNNQNASAVEPASSIEENMDKLMCIDCTKSSSLLHCFVCKKSDTTCIPCCDKNCGKAYHKECLKYWPQHKKTYISNDIKSLHCSRHVCHTCVSPDIRNMFHNTESDKKLIKCLQCPGTYHRSSECIPAGSELLSETQLICARHQIKNVKRINIDYCLFCSKGGRLICCDGCAYSFHQDCLQVPVDDYFNCEECESGRRPLNGEIVWCKYSISPWWPSIIVPPPCIPSNVLAKKKEPNQICVYFFGTHDYGWVPQAHIYLYLADDGPNTNDGPALKNAIAEAEQWMQRFNEINKKNTKITNHKPPPYRKIKTNKVIAKYNEPEYNECKCRKEDPAPCSTENGCYNAHVGMECDPELCPAKEKCQNQNFHRGEQFAFEVKMTDAKGWGLFAKEKIPIDYFIIEYMGEVIDNVEFDQRFSRATANKDDNYYFLTLGNNLYIDAKLYGNEARFINHSCDPNAAPNKWTVYSSGQGQIRIGFFALRNIQPGEEITFDYNWGTKNMTVCQCGSEKCRGHI